ncbi:hypothetical protein BJP44_04115 [Candidatus Williamhamiltonella defendens]|nr:hypothetical protein BJP44_04115 [Candidatus Hamiltonella defensa]
MTVKGFLVEDSVIYGGGAVIDQRSNLIAACETAGAGTLIHPTYGELTVSIPSGGSRLLSNGITAATLSSRSGRSSPG